MNKPSDIQIVINEKNSTQISKDLFGIFFEDINYAADGGLYAELIQNRSFEYTSSEQRDWNFFTAWELIQRDGGAWSKITANIECSADSRDSRFVLLIDGHGTLALDMVSLFPSNTFCNRPNGMRADLAQTIADLKPRFVRFPGGCLVHGDGLANMYRWKDTVGPVETRKGQRNIWGYHQSLGIGYNEYFQFCEDIGAKPLPVVPAAVCCQNSGAVHNGLWGEGQCGIPMEEMPEYIQEILDLIEWANGPAASKWGKVRAEAGHPEPFNLEYLGVGNEDRITESFKERFAMIYKAVKARYPEIQIVGTSGPFHSGEDFEEGWKLANELNLELIDEHYYVSPDWMWDNLTRYDSYDREKGDVYLGEYAASVHGGTNLNCALAEAAYLTSIERNGDIVRLTSYAPLLAKQHHTQWTTDMIYFNNTEIKPTPSYFVQQLFSRNAGDLYLHTELFEKDGKSVAASCVKDSESGDIIVKIVSRLDREITSLVDIATGVKLASRAECVVLSGDLDCNNQYGSAISPVESTVSAGSSFSITLPPYSLTVIRLKGN